MPVQRIAPFCIALFCAAVNAADAQVAPVATTSSITTAEHLATRRAELKALYLKFDPKELSVAGLKSTTLSSSATGTLTWSPDADIFDTQVIDVLERPADDLTKRILEEYLSKPPWLRDAVGGVPEIKALYDFNNFPRDPFDPRAIPTDPAPMAANLATMLAAVNAIQQTAEALRLAADLGSPNTKAFIAQCHDAAAAMLALRKTLGNRFDPDGLNLVAEPQKALATVDEYVESCLSEPSDLDANVRATLDSRVGVFAISDQIMPYKCSVTRIGEDRVLTARHCLFRAGTSPLQLWPAENRYVYLLADPTKRLKVLSVTHPAGVDPRKFDDEDDLNDWVVLKIERPATAYSPLTVDGPKRFERVLIYGYQPLLAFRDRLALRMLAKQPGANFGAAALLPRRTWDQMIRYDDSAICSLAALSSEGACALHGCQTEGGLSGAPMFSVASDGRLSLVAMHIRSVHDNDTRPCSKGAPTGVPNCGLAAPPLLANVN